MPDEVKNRMVSIVQVIIGIVTAIIGFVIVDGVISTQSWNNSLSATIASYITPIGLLGVLALAAFLAAR